MSRELTEFSDMIDDQFDVTDNEDDDFWESIVNLFI